ncbi:hypothetical protein SAMN02745150_00058 [Brevinema andersonii]|uniref:Uncharacterized protein n=1 Tax=Brevinema andersonii TaxID=34097 RepID=A0A1I1D2S3_BREAD|nr:hypothetical protein [Brevinema andersonii]SFB67408.1 hypothetical protein SAMN02745150_00058 [Brevinema andersonii]
MTIREQYFNISKEKSLKCNTDTYSIKLEPKILSVINGLPGVKLYSVSDENYINQFVSLAPENNSVSYTPPPPNQKPLDS